MNNTHKGIEASPVKRNAETSVVIKLVVGDKNHGEEEPLVDII